MVHRAGQVGMRDSDSSEGPVAQHIAGGRLSFKPEEEARLWIDEGMAKPVEHNPGYIAFGVKAGGAEHLHHLLADLALIVRERSGEQFRPAQLPLSKRRKPRL